MYEFLCIDKQREVQTKVIISQRTEENAIKVFKKNYGNLYEFKKIKKVM